MTVAQLKFLKVIKAPHTVIFFNLFWCWLYHTAQKHMPFRTNLRAPFRTYSVMVVKMSESPASVMLRTDTRKKRPQAVPRSTLEPA